MQDCESEDRRKMHEPEQLRKMFIGGLDYGTSDETLKEFYEQWGTVVDVVVMKDPKTRRSRGFGFITYSQASMVDDAMANRPHKIDGRQVEPKRAVPRDLCGKGETNVRKLFIGGIGKLIDKEDLEDYFGKYGKLTDCAIVVTKDTGERRGFGFVEYDDVDAADKVILIRDHEIKGRRVEVKKAIARDDMRNDNNRGGMDKGRGGRGGRDGRGDYGDNQGNYGGGGGGGGGWNNQGGNWGGNQNNNNPWSNQQPNNWGNNNAWGNNPCWGNNNGYQGFNSGMGMGMGNNMGSNMGSNMGMGMGNMGGGMGMGTGMGMGNMGNNMAGNMGMGMGMGGMNNMGGGGGSGYNSSNMAGGGGGGGMGYNSSNYGGGSTSSGGPMRGGSYNTNRSAPYSTSSKQGGGGGGGGSGSTGGSFGSTGSGDRRGGGGGGGSGGRYNN